MSADDGDDDARRRKLDRDALGARRRRADRRAAREAASFEASSTTEATADDACDGDSTAQDVVDVATATAATGGVPTASGAVSYLQIRHSSLLDEHIRRATRYLALLEADKSVSILEKTRLFVGSIAALAKGVEAVEFTARLEALERRADARDRRGRW